MAKKGSVNPLNVLEIRRVGFCPPYFESVTLAPGYNLAKAIDEWIYDNLSGRYFIGNALEICQDNNKPFTQRIKIGFENPSELSYFVLACPILKYSK